MAAFVDIKSVLRGLASAYAEQVRDFSYDVYCPKTYSHHTRLTFWQPPFYLRKYSYSQLQTTAIQMLKSLGVKNYRDYVVGINSRVNQYDEHHFLLLDFDSKAPEIIRSLRQTRGYVFQSGRGLHFVGAELLMSDRAWRVAMQRAQGDEVLGRHIDQKFIEYSLARGYGTLRVTKGTNKPHVPRFFCQT